MPPLVTASCLNFSPFSPHDVLAFLGDKAEAKVPSMFRASHIAGVSALLTLAACATAPAPGGQYGAFSETLRICPGLVSNAPAADGGRRVAGFTPTALVAGVSLARAPTSGCVSSGFGPRRGGAGRFHYGLDIFTDGPRPVYAGGDGVVEEVKSLRGYGRSVLIRHNSRVKTRYAHLSAYERGLSPGDRVRKGAPIGYTGASGNATAIHLHYEIIVNGRPRDPLTAGR